MQKNVKISKIDKKRNKLLKSNKFLLKRLEMSYIFWANVSKESTENVEALNERLCTYFYVDSTISSILQT